MAMKRVRPIRQFPLDPDLIAGLKKLSARLHEPAAAIVRRALRRELERQGILKEAKK
jgi:predicted transcriptional regulator